MDNKMINVFNGVVNDRKFDDRDEMNKYIGELITAGETIYELSFSNTTRSVTPDQEPIKTVNKDSDRTRPVGRTAIEHAQSHSWTKYMYGINNNKVPKPYDNVISYIVPYVREDIEISEENWHNIVGDVRDKLNNRMVFMEQYIFRAVKSGQYDTAQVKAWFNELCDKLSYKASWAIKRFNEINEFINSIPDNKFISDRIDTTYLNTMYILYSDVNGFCRALIDICNEKVANLK